eukprot:m.266683 g.266683  ORF g.266683 m.266683 type:complete len:359 (-) comp54705_c0_seq3:412-1488(-)
MVHLRSVLFFSFRGCDYSLFPSPSPWCVCSIGHSISESWQFGSAFQDLWRREVELKQRQEVLMAEQKRLKSLKRKTKAEESSGSAPVASASTPGGFALPGTFPKREASASASDEVYEQSEILYLNLVTAKAKQEQLEAERIALDLERNIHAREMKRIQDEDACFYKEVPTVFNRRYFLISLLGKGGFSEVYKAYDMIDSRMVACKVHQLDKHWSDAKKESYIKHATREYEIHKSIHHEHVVELYDVFEIDANSFCTVLEYCSGQDLDFVLKQSHTLTERDARSKIAQILSALKHFNTEVHPPVIHYDLKPANVLLVDGCVKITDFGLSKQLTSHDEFGNIELTSQVLAFEPCTFALCL